MVSALDSAFRLPLPIIGGTGLYRSAGMYDVPSSSRLPWHTTLSNIANVPDAALWGTASFSLLAAPMGMAALGVPALAAWGAWRAASQLAFGPMWGMNPFHSAGYFRPGMDAESRPSASRRDLRWDYEPRTIAEDDNAAGESSGGAEGATTEAAKGKGTGTGDKTKGTGDKSKKPIGTPQDALNVSGAVWSSDKKTVTITRNDMTKQQLTNAANAYAKKLQRANHKGIIVTVKNATDSVSKRS